MLVRDGCVGVPSSVLTLLVAVSTCEVDRVNVDSDH